MALVSKSKAAKLAGVSRTTIHRYVNVGKLSMTGDKVDTSELIRVFGSLHAVSGEQPATGATGNNFEHDATPEVQGVLHSQLRALEEQVNDLRSERDHWRKQSDGLVELLKTEQESTRLLTHQGKKKGSDAVALVVLIICSALVAAALLYTTL